MSSVDTSQDLTSARPPSRARTGKVLLLGNDDRVLLAAIRSLGRKGIEVDVAWCDESLPALRSRYLGQYHKLPVYENDGDDWLVALNRWVRDQNYDLVMPINDFAVVPLQTHHESLDQNARWYLINQRAFEIGFDKIRTRKAAQSLGIPVPHEMTLSSGDILKLGSLSAVSDLDGEPVSFPIYIKPKSSITCRDVTNKRSVRFVEDAEQLAATLRESAQWESVLLQEEFDGEGIGVEVLARRGRVVMELQHRRLRETLDGGSTYRETIAGYRDLSHAAARMVEFLDYTGVAMFEFRRDPVSGRYVLLEINARFWGSLPLAIAAGADFPFALYTMLVTGKVPVSIRYRRNVRCRNLIADLRAFRQQRRNNRTRRRVFDWWRLAMCRDHLDHFCRDDWRPQWSQLWQFAGSLFGRIIGRHCSSA